MTRRIEVEIRADTRRLEYSLARARLAITPSFGERLRLRCLMLRKRLSLFVRPPRGKRVEFDFGDKP